MIRQQHISVSYIPFAMLSPILVFIFALLAVSTFAEDMSSYHYKDGRLEINSAHPSQIEGPVLVDFMETRNVTTIAGIYVDSGGEKTPFFFSAAITSYTLSGKKFVATAACTEAGWGFGLLRELTGTVTVIGVYKETAIFSGTCAHTQGNVVTRYTLRARGTYAKDFHYTPSEAARRAPMIVGQRNYRSEHVLHFAVFGYPFISPRVSCAWYREFTQLVDAPQPGYVIIGSDGNHCGIIDAEGDKFVQMDETKMMVTLTSMVNLRQFFPNGYEFRSY